MPGLASVDLNLLPPLRALLRHRSVTRAAEEIGVSQPTMSNTLRRLRRLLGDELLVRVGKTYQLTARASALIEPLDTALQTIQNEVVEVPAFSPADSRRTFTVASSNVAAATVLSPLARRLVTEAPGVALHVIPLVQSPDRLLDDSGVDLVLLPDTIRTQLPRERLYDEDWVLVVDADNTGIGDTVELSDLAHLPHVVFQVDGLSTGAELALRAAIPDRRVLATVSDFLTIPFLIRGTTAISVIQERVARLLEAHGLVRVVRSPLRLPRFGIDLVWNQRGTGDPACAWLREHLYGVVSGG
jgi:DNA-binding transcriptional LysR family regulator